MFIRIPSAKPSASVLIDSFSVSASCIDANEEGFSKRSFETDFHECFEFSSGLTLFKCVEKPIIIP